MKEKLTSRHNGLHKRLNSRLNQIVTSTQTVCKGRNLNTDYTVQSVNITSLKKKGRC